MRRMWQQDALRYLTNRHQKSSVPDAGLPFGLNLPLKNVRLDLGLGGDDSRLSNFVNRKKDAAYLNVAFDPAKAFDALIQPLLEAGPLTPEVALANFREFLRSEGIIDEWWDYADYRGCMIAVFREVFPRHYPIDPEPESDTVPRLRAQRFPLSAFFLGRENDLSRMEELLDAEGALILSGVGGIGKTMLAEEYARRGRDKYRSVQMITAEPSCASYKDLLLGVQFDGVRPELQLTESERVSRCMQLLLDLDESTLLIFNNVDQEMNDYGLFRRVLRESGAHILVTTRRLSLFPEGAELNVESLEDDEQLSLLAQAAGRKLGEDETEDAANICRRVAGHTLLIQLLGRAMAEQKLPAGQLLKKMNSISGFPALDANVSVQKDDYNKNTEIRTFVREILFNLSPLSEAQRDLLRYLTLLPLSGVDEDLLLSQDFPIDADLLSNLERGGWIIRDPEENALRLHPVVREAILSELKVNSDTCTPFLCGLDKLLWEPEISPFLIDELRLAAAAVEMLFISEDLRRMLADGSLDPIFAQVDKTAPSGRMWGEWGDRFLEDGKDPDLTPESSRTLEMYAAFCEYMNVLQRARDVMQSGKYDLPFMDAELTCSALRTLGAEDELGAAQTKLVSLYEELRGASPSEPGMDALITAAVGGEVSEYLIDAGWAQDICPEETPVPSFRKLLDPEDMRKLSALGDRPYAGFLITALEAFEHCLTLMPFVASSAVNTLTLLFSLQETASAGYHTMREIADETGWHFPELHCLPDGFQAAGAPYFTEKLWGMPELTQIYERGDDTILIRMNLPRKWEMDDFELLPYEVIEDRDGLRILSALPGMGPSCDVQVVVDGFVVRIQGDGDVTAQEAVRIARGLKSTRRDRDPGRPGDSSEEGEPQNRLAGTSKPAEAD